MCFFNCVFVVTLFPRYLRATCRTVHAARTRLGSRDALATLSCRLTALHRGGDHHIIVGEVDALTHSEGEPLVFFSGGYQRLA